MSSKTISRVFALLGGLLVGAPAQGALQEVVALAPASLAATDHAAIEARWGIRIQGLHLTAAGYMLDFRYKVVDPGKAAPLFDRKFKPVLRDEKTGAVMAVPAPPKTGALRSSNDPKEGRTYFMFFANPAHFIGKYSRVTVSIGEFSISGLTVK